MIAYLEGVVGWVQPDHLVLKTTSGVGYQIYFPSSLLRHLAINAPFQCHVHTHVREGEIALYGFPTIEEKQLFEMLIKTSGVGPKSGIAVLSTLRPPQLLRALQNHDLHTLSTVPGVGKKTATKLCLDMADQLKKHPILLTDKMESVVPSSLSHQEELLSALLNMGFAEKSVLAILNQVPSDNVSFQEQIRKALALLTSAR